MTRESTYGVVRLENLKTSLQIDPSERDCDFLLSDSRWSLVFRDGRRGISGGLLHSRLSVEEAGRRTCRLTIEDDTGSGFGGTAIVRASAATLLSDLERRSAMLERSGEIVAAVAAGSWWLDVRVFEELDWSQRRSLAGVHYRSGWWGTGRLPPSMLPKVLDFGPRGIVLRGWRTRLVIPWDAIGSIGIFAGDGWTPTHTAARHGHPMGTTLVIRSLADQDAVFYAPLSTVNEVDQLLAPLVDRLPGGVPATR